MEMPIVKREHIDELMRLLSYQEGTMEDKLAIAEIENQIKRENSDLHQFFHDGIILTEASTYCYFLLRKAANKPISFIPRVSISRTSKEYYNRSNRAWILDRIEKNNLEYAGYISSLFVATKASEGDILADQYLDDGLLLYFLIETLAR